MRNEGEACDANQCRPYEAKREHDDGKTHYFDQTIGLLMGATFFFITKLGAKSFFSIVFFAPLSQELSPS